MANHSGVSSWLSWLGGHEKGILVWVCLIAAGTWGFALLADEVLEGGTVTFDRQVLLAMRHGPDLEPIGSPAVQEAARDITALGGVMVLTIVTGIAIGFLVLDGKRRMAVFVAVAVLSGMLAGVVLKRVFHRSRPDIVPHAVYVDSTSFPSGHSMMSAVTYLTLGALLARSHEQRRFRAYFLLLAVLLTVMVGITRVYLGVHWPTDVLGGWCVGAAWAMLCWWVAVWLQRRGSVEKPGEHAPEPNGNPDTG